MLSQAHQTTKMNSAQPQQGLHSRQQSMPSFEVSHMTPLPAGTDQIRTARTHRKGASLSASASQKMQPQVQQQQQYLPQGGPYMVSITNPGQRQSQHYLQEAQQHRQALPGLPEHTLRVIEEIKRRKEEEVEAEIASYIRQTNAGSSHSFEFSTGRQREQQTSHAQPMERSKSNPFDSANLRSGRVAVGDCSPAPALNNVDDFRAAGQHESRRPSTAEGAAAFAGRASQRSNWARPPQRRPVTPAKRSSTGQTLMTPNTSPYALVADNLTSEEPDYYELMDTSKTIRISQKSAGLAGLSHQLFEVPESPEPMDTSATLRPRPAMLAVVPQADFFDPPTDTEQNMPSPPNSATLRRNEQFSLSQLIPTTPSQLFDEASTQIFVPQTPVRQSSPSAPYDLPVHGRSSQGQRREGGDVTSMGNRQSWTAERRDSIFNDDLVLDLDLDMEGAPDAADATDAGSPGLDLEDIKIEATQEDTGISADEVQRYISDADPDDGKWSCLFEGCDKRFGRKENVRAHVQTHLGDRQYRCPVCAKCFVRQHDLKRHLKTHSGSKPYPCACGRDFARHDALTRHRQRNNCCGGVQGFVQKSSKRGRPRKERPTGDERANKAALTRMRQHGQGQHQHKSYPSSMSGAEDYASSDAHSPRSLQSELDHALARYDAEVERQMRDHAQKPRSTTPPSSPYSTGDVASQAVSPSSTWTHSRHESRNDLEGVAADAGSPSPSSPFGSVGDSPPALSESSPPRLAHALDLDAPMSDWFCSTSTREVIDADDNVPPPTFSADFFTASTHDGGQEWKGEHGDFNLDSFIRYDDDEASQLGGDGAKYGGIFGDVPTLSDGIDPLDFAFRG